MLAIGIENTTMFIQKILIFTLVKEFHSKCESSLNFDHPQQLGYSANKVQIIGCVLKGKISLNSFQPHVKKYW